MLSTLSGSRPFTLSWSAPVLVIPTKQRNTMPATRAGTAGLGEIV